MCESVRSSVKGVIKTKLFANAQKSVPGSAIHRSSLNSRHFSFAGEDQRKSQIDGEASSGKDIALALRFTTWYYLSARENIIASILLSLPGLILIILCPALFWDDGLRFCGGH
jgi:hypothetical protein